MKKTFLILALAATLVACHDNSAPQQQGYAFTQPPVVTAPTPAVVQTPAPQTVVVQQQPQSDHMLTGALLGGALGYMAGSANRQPDYHSRPVYVDRRPVYNTTVVQKKVFVVNQTPKAAPAPVYSPKPAPTLSLSKSSSSFGGFNRRK